MNSDLTEDQRQAAAAWDTAQTKAEQGRLLLEEAAADARQAVTSLHHSGLTQKRIAALLGITQGRVSQLIDRTPRND